MCKDEAWPRRLIWIRKASTGLLLSVVDYSELRFILRLLSVFSFFLSFKTFSFRGTVAWVALGGMEIATEADPRRGPVGGRRDEGIPKAALLYGCGHPSGIQDHSLITWNTWEHDRNNVPGMLMSPSYFFHFFRCESPQLSEAVKDGARVVKLGFH